jgi:hypothetical protein
MMIMFNHFFKTQNNSGKEIKLFGEKQQQHLVLLDSNQTIEYFELEEVVKPCNTTIKNLKACDYILVDHNNKRILFCELKNSSNRNVIVAAREQLNHSKHIVSLFLNILGEGEYSCVLLTLTTRKMNKKTTQPEQIQAIKYAETNKKTFNFNSLNYAKN